MKPYDLRIGNLLMKNGIVVTIDDRSIFDIWVSSFHPYDGITLTEEWIERLGYKKLATKNWYHPTTMRFELRNTSALQGGFKIHAVKGPHILTNKIDFVHTLQNIHFAFTNEELKQI